MIVYGASLSPYVRKVLVVATEKGMEFEHKVSPPGAPDPDFLACSPFRKIPALRDGDFGISDSTAIVHYLEAVKPDPAMIPAEAKARAKVVWFEEFADTILSAPIGTMFYNRVVAPKFMGREGDLAAADKAEAEVLPPAMDYLECVAPESGFLVGDSITLADIGVCTMIQNILHLGIDIGRWPKTKAYAEAILARPSFARWVETERRVLGR
ncbi:MAG: glutathione S-transferase family protein [Ignavibacteriales bacterium]